MTKRKQSGYEFHNLNPPVVFGQNPNEKAKARRLKTTRADQFARANCIAEPSKDFTPLNYREIAENPI